MPSTSQAQQRYFGAIAGGSIPKPKGMSDKTVHDFASTPRNGLPEHKADGGWMARARMMADGKWAGDAFKHAGEKGHSLHDTLGVPHSEPIPASKVRGAAHSSNEHTRKMAQVAINMNPGRYR